MQRKLTAILAADVVGYSRLMRTDETGTFAAMKALWGEVVQPSVKAHRGRVFKLMGDGMLAEFASVVDAASAAEAIQTAANARAEGEAEDKAIRLRIGINLGDVVVDGSDLYGDGVNIAARLQEVAETGGIAVSEDTHRQLRGKSSIEFEDGGEHTLKNIDQPIRVWLWPQATEQLRVTHPTETSRKALQPGIAVLPFQNLSPDPDTEFFADGMAEDIINGLSKFRWLFVIARGTMFTFKGKNVPTSSVARELGVRYVLEGSVRQAGRRIRVSGQLVDTETGNHLWTERFDRTLEDLFEIQDEITNAITAAIAPEISLAEQIRARRAPENLDAWGKYQLGLMEAAAYTVDGFQKGIVFLRESVLGDPDFAPARFALATTLIRGVNVGVGESREQTLKEAYEQVSAGLRIDRNDADGRAALAMYFAFIGNANEAEREARQSIAVNPNSAWAHTILCHALLTKGDAQGMIDNASEAWRLSPTDPANWRLDLMRGICHRALGEFDEAVFFGRRACKGLGESSLLTNLQLASTFATMGDIEEAHIALKRARELVPNVSINYVSSIWSHMDPILLKSSVDGLRIAGLEEHSQVDE